MPEKLKEQVLEANLELWRKGLILFTWGNVSAIDRETGLVVIKPSGVPYEQLTTGNLTVVNLEGKQFGKGFKPSSDTATHLELYRAFPNINSVAHSHSHFATVWAQARRPIPALGTTGADYFHGEIPITRPITAGEISRGYEVETGRVIVERFADLDPASIPGVLVHSHGPFTWGATPAAAVENMIVLEEIARLAWHTLALEPGAQPMDDALLDKHFLRKHGSGKYYGQD